LILLTALVLIPLLTTGVSAADRWSDISDQDWLDTYQVSAQEVRTVAEGFGDGTFRPAALVSRAQFAKMAVDGLGVSVARPDAPTFSDTPESDYFYPWIEGAAAAHLIGGYADGSFRGQQSVSRQQANSMVGLYLSQRELGATGSIQGEEGRYASLGEWYLREGAELLAGFNDAIQVAQAHAQSTAYLVARGVVKGSGLVVAAGSTRYLHVGGSLTRAQAAAMIIRARSVTFAAPATLRLSVTGIPDPLTAGETSDVTVTVLDQSNNVATDYTGTVRFASTDAQAGLPADYAFKAADAGTHTFTGGVVLQTTGVQTVSAADIADQTVTGSRTVTVVAGGGDAPGGGGVPGEVVPPVVRFAVTTGPGPVTAGIPLDLTAAVVDSHSTVVTTYRGRVFFSSSDPKATLPAPDMFTSADQGLRVFPDSVVLRTAGPQTIAVRDASGTILDTLRVNVLPGAATELRIETASDGSGAEIGARTLAAGGALTAYAISVDAYGNFAGNPSVTWALADTTGGVVVSDLSGATGAGVIFTGHVVGTGVIQATAGTLTDSTGTVTVVAGPAAGLSIEAAPDGSGAEIGAQTLAAGSTVTAYAVTRDVYGNFAGNPSVTWSLADITGGVVAGDLVASVDGASANFTGHVEGTGVIQAISGTLTGATASAGVTVVPGPAARLRLETAPDGSGREIGDETVVAGHSLNIYAIARDAYGNFVALASPFMWIFDDAGGVNYYTDYVSKGPGWRVFTGHLIGTVRISASVMVPPSNNKISDSTGLITVVAGPAATLRVDAPATVTAGTPFDVTVTALDAYTNVATGYPGTVHLTSGDSHATLPGDYTFVAGDAGSHLFDDAMILGTVGPQTITVRDDATGSIVGQRTVNVLPGAPSQVRVETAANGGGTEIGDAMVARGDSLTAYAVSRDLYGNFVANVSVTWSLVDITGSVVAGDLVPAADGRSAVFTHNLAGAGVIQATLGESSDVTGTLTANTPPVLGYIATPRTVNEGGLLEFTATASDVDTPAQTLTFSLVGAPPVATIGYDDDEPGGFFWVPTFLQGGASYTFDIVVSDGISSDSQSVTVIVNNVP